MLNTRCQTATTEPTIFIMDGLFIVFEGMDGSGKGTLVKLTSEWLKSTGIEPVMAKEPGGTTLGQHVRSIMYESVTTHEMAPNVVDCLLLADHLQNVEELVKPAIAAGKWVISDRYAYSQYAYEKERQVHPGIQLAYRDLLGPEPDLIFLLVGNPAILMERANQRRSETHQKKKSWNDLGKLSRIQQNYLKQLAPKENTVVVFTDATPASQIFSEQIKPRIESTFTARLDHINQLANLSNCA